MVANYDQKGEESVYNILICDDQPDIVNALKIYLAPEGYRLLEAFNGRQALEPGDRSQCRRGRLYY